MTHDLHRQTLDQIKAGRDWTRAEQQVLEEAHTGEVIIDDALPDDAGPKDERSIRAGLLRHITLGSVVLASLRRGWDRWLMKPLFAYGHQPSRALKTVVIILLLNTALYFVAYRTDQMAPTSAVVLTSQDWTDHVALLDGALDTGARTLHLWDQTATAKDYTTFQPFLYALDLFIPLDALGQEEAWAPSPTRGLWGQVGFWSGWLTQLSGWLITAIAAAAVAGIVGRKD